ncbi:hypothetical protein R6G85_02435 [Actinotignum urinale]|uniref:VG15 protein n=1 Tax=Actinotignum urinale TaxID=190146 RepID=UPI002A82DA8A|nr:hypothetical protein [Actinotignum urinale]MDY5151345.1 hypothetical protein [Actinotignum urinale]
MASEKQIQTYRKAQKLLEDALKKDLQALWDKTSSFSPADTSVFLQEAIPLLVDKYGVMVATVAVNWFEQLTGEKGFVPSSYRREAWEISTRWALSKLGEENTSRQEIFNRLVGSTLRHVRQHGRDTIDTSVCEYKDVFYARKIVGETCDFCLILASRGPVYGSEKSAGGEGNKYHDDCDCLPVPVKGKWVPNSGSPMGVSWVGDSPGYDFEKLYETEYKPFWQKNDDVKDVLRRRRTIAVSESLVKKVENKSNVSNALDGGGGNKKPSRPPVSSADDRAGKNSDNWKHRQKKLLSDTADEVLEPHEIEFLEKFEKLGHHARWIPIDVKYRKSTNDFVWLDLDSEICELKVTSAKYSTIKSHIKSSVIKARDNHEVTKDFFVIDLGDKELTSKLRNQLSKYNARVTDGHIRRLWVMSSKGAFFEEINLS